jgi:hypothetical protein
MIAGQLWAGPDAVLTGQAAACLSFWPDVTLTDLTFATPESSAGRPTRR